MNAARGPGPASAAAEAAPAAAPEAAAGEGRAPVARILPSSAVDGPGNRAVVFLQGCDFDCRYCHNPETRNLCTGCGACVPACPAGALAAADGRVAWDPGRCVDCGACVRACPEGSTPKARRMTAAEVLAALGRRRPFLSGLTVSGGECGLWPDFLESLAAAGRAAGLPVLVDTNGSADYAGLPGLVAAAEGFMLDLKAWSREAHLALCGVPNDAVLRNLRFLAGAGKLAELRTVVVPGLVDAEACVLGGARVLREARSRARYRLIRFRPEGVRPAWRGLPVPDDALMARLAELARAEGAAEVLVV